GADGLKRHTIAPVSALATSAATTAGRTRRHKGRTTGTGVGTAEAARGCAANDFELGAHVANRLPALLRRLGQAAAQQFNQSRAKIGRQRSEVRLAREH